MTTAIDDIVAAARSLPRAEQLEVLRRLAESLGGTDPTLESLAAGFWTSRSLDELAAEQQVAAVTDVQTLAMPDWPEEERADEVIAFVREQRQADRGV